MLFWKSFPWCWIKIPRRHLELCKSEVKFCDDKCTQMQQHQTLHGMKIPESLTSSCKLCFTVSATDADEPPRHFACQGCSVRAGGWWQAGGAVQPQQQAPAPHEARRGDALPPEEPATESHTDLNPARRGLESRGHFGTDAQPPPRIQLTAWVERSHSTRLERRDNVFLHLHWKTTRINTVNNRAAVQTNAPCKQGCACGPCTARLIHSQSQRSVGLEMRSRAKRQIRKKKAPWKLISDESLAINQLVWGETLRSWTGLEPPEWKCVIKQYVRGYLIKPESICVLWCKFGTSQIKTKWNDSLTFTP